MDVCVQRYQAFLAENVAVCNSESPSVKLRKTLYVQYKGVGRIRWLISEGIKHYTSDGQLFVSTPYVMAG